MRLQCLAGAYAGQVREYGAVAGLAALKVGTAARIGDVGPAQSALVPDPPAAVKAANATPASSKRRPR